MKNMTLVAYIMSKASTHGLIVM